MYTSRFDHLLNPSAIKNRTKSLAYRSVQDAPDYFLFKGTGQDYSRASMYFLAVQERRGARTIAELYETMNSEKIDFFEAIYKKLHWNRARLEKEVQKLLGQAQDS